MTFNELAKQRRIEARQYNIVEVRNDVKKSWVQEKIISFCERQGDMFTPSFVEEQILNNDIVAAVFAKDPSKQNITEKLVEEQLHIKKLPASGKNCIRFAANGTLVHATGVDVSKSADFKIGDIYYTQKYTIEAGGAQDNQYNDVVDFLNKGSIHHKVGAILDGDYWDNTKRQELRSYFANNNNVIITSVDELRGD